MACLFNSIVPHRLSKLWQDDSHDNNGHMMSKLGAWDGETKILVGIDIGTTYSGVAFAFLEKGSSQVIHRVTRWPGQDAREQQSKIPTLIWYDSNQKAVAFGAEAQLDEVEEQAEDNCWFLAKHFKLHLHPDDMKTKHNLKLDALPPGVTLRQIYSDFLRYLIKHTQTYFEDRVLDGKRIWERYSPKMEVVIAHPNGYSLKQQAFLRKAAIAGGLAGDDTASSKIRFVTEAEASVHYCIHYADMKNVLKPKANFVVCDAGGSTVDTTLYTVVSATPLKIKELRDSACVQAGAIFVDLEMKKYLETALAKTELNPEDTEFYTKTGVKDFESYAKRNFRSKSAEYTVIVADSRFNNPDIKTRRGRMTIPGSTVQTFFDPCVNEIKSSVDTQIGTRKVPYLILLGGLGANGYVQSEFKRHYESRKSKLILSDDSSCKAVADGAVIWGTSDNVVARAPRYSFGLEASLRYRRSLINDLAGRKPYTSLAGDLRVSGGWSEIVHKGDPINAGVIHRQTYHNLYEKPTLCSNPFEVKLCAYSGNDKPKWARSRHGEQLDRFRVVCTITANLQTAEGGMKRRINPSGSEYWALEFCVCIRFSGTELESFLEWKENGVQKTGAASIVLPEEDILD